MIQQLLGVAAIVGLLALVATWLLWIAEKMTTRKHGKKEENDAIVNICHCKKCGYVGRISFARNGYWSRKVKETYWNCPNCGNILWDEVDVKSVWRDEEEKEIERMKKGAQR